MVKKFPNLFRGRYNLIIKNSSLIILLGFLHLFASCGPRFYDPRTITRVSWHESENSLLFRFFYNPGNFDVPKSQEELYLLNLDSKIQPRLTKISKSTKELLPYFRDNANAFLFEFQKQLIPRSNKDVSPLNDANLINYAHFNNTINKIVVNYNSLKGETSAETTYSIIDPNDKTYQNISFSSNTGLSVQDNPLIHWTGVDYDVLVEYIKQDQIYHALGKIDPNTAVLDELKIFKKHVSRKASQKGAFLLSKQSEETDVIVLGFEDKNTVYIAERLSNSTKVSLQRINIQEGSVTLIATLDSNNSYFSNLAEREQISIKRKKVAYVESGNQDLYITVSNLDGTDKVKVLSLQQDLPKSGLFPLPL